MSTSHSRAEDPADKSPVTSAEEHRYAEELKADVDALEARVAEERATGVPSPVLLAELKDTVELYQAARIAADRPRQA